YQVEGQILYAASALPTNVGIGFSFPGMIYAAGTIRGGTTVSNVVSVVQAQFQEDSSTSMIWSAAISTVSTLAVIVDALFAVSTAGTIQALARVSATTQPINVQPGSFLRAYKVR
ncbi:MAG: hypothetical protein ACREIQ_04425, partial [Nitrospiria bacterium]